MPGKVARRFYFPVAAKTDVNWFIPPPTRQVCSRPHACPRGEESGGHRVLHLKEEGSLPPRAPPPLSSNSIHPTGSLRLSFSFGTRLSLSPLHTFPRASLGQRQIKPSFPPGVHHTDASAGGGEGQSLAQRNARQTRANRCAWRPGPTPGPAQKASSQPCARGIALFSPRPNHLFTEKKKNLKKYKLLLCEIKVPLSGASG